MFDKYICDINRKSYDISKGANNTEKIYIKTSKREVQGNVSVTD